MRTSLSRGRARRRVRDERGQSLSVFFGLVSVALILVVGLVVDGGQKVLAERDCQAAATDAARAAADAGSTDVLGGASLGEDALASGRRALAHYPDVSGEASRGPGGVVEVTVRASRPTYFLSLVGIDHVSAEATRRAEPVVVDR